MASAIEVGGVPSMILGLIVALKGVDSSQELLNRAAKIFAYSLLTIGIAYSLYDFGGITAFSQVLEIVMIAGFLIGTYLLARKSPVGWLWFMPMNTSAGILMFIQDKPYLALQQALSLCFVIRGYVLSRRAVKSAGS